MSYPSDGTEENAHQHRFWNRIEDVKYFLEENHKGHYYIFNL